MPKNTSKLHQCMNTQLTTHRQLLLIRSDWTWLKTAPGRTELRLTRDTTSTYDYVHRAPHSSFMLHCAAYILLHHRHLFFLRKTASSALHSLELVAAIFFPGALEDLERELWVRWVDSGLQGLWVQAWFFDIGVQEIPRILSSLLLPHYMKKTI